MNRGAAPAATGSGLWSKLFRAFLAGAVGVLVLFFLSLLVSLAGSTSLQRFLDLLVARDIRFAVRLSFITATISTALAMCVAVPGAYALSRASFPGKQMTDTLLDLPIVLSPVALGAALLLFFNNAVGAFIERYFIEFVFSVPGLVLAQFTVVSALAMRLLKSTFDSIDTRYEKVGRVMGCSRMHAFSHVALPLAKPGILAAGILCWARAVGEFGASVTLAGATAMKTETLPISIYLSLASADVERAVAAIFVLVFIALGSLLIVRRVTGAGYGP
ncbi:MAG: ABC transporter permease [Planctomycetota bacterium]